MALGRKESRKQADLWIATQDLPKPVSHPFYSKLNEILDKHGFDQFVEEKTARFYAAKNGRPSLPPGNYFRLLFIGYFEGIVSERGIAWRVADSLGLRHFLGFSLTENTPDHSTMSKIRSRIDLETHSEIFSFALQILAREKILVGKSVGIDATTLEANAAMRGIIRRDTGATYHEFLTEIAKESGIETPTKEELLRFDRKRKKKTSNKDWESPVDPDSKIAKMKNGSTKLAHKVEHAVDLDSGAIVGITLQGADLGDTTTIHETVRETLLNLADATNNEGDPSLRKSIISEIIADKGYHSSAALLYLKEFGTNTIIAEPDRGRRKWDGKEEEQNATYANRRRTRSNRGKSLMRQRGELVERSFAHCYETGGMRHIYLRGHSNILKRLFAHIAGFNLSLIMRKIFGKGTPRGFGELPKSLWQAFCNLLMLFSALFSIRWNPKCNTPSFSTRIFVPTVIWLVTLNILEA